MNNTMHTNLLNQPLPTRDEYLAAVAAWRTAYRELSATQRKLKLEMREAQRQGGGPNAGLLHLALLRGRDTATAMLLQRAAMKLLARQSYLLARAASRM